jgi:hypothetical protein
MGKSACSPNQEPRSLTPKNLLLFLEQAVVNLVEIAVIGRCPERSVDVQIEFRPQVYFHLFNVQGLD